MKNNKFIVLTGGSGSIGKEIVKFLIKKYKIINIDRSKLNLKSVDNIICDLNDIDLLKEKLKILENKF